MSVIRLIISSYNSFETNHSKANLSVNTIRSNLLSPVSHHSLYIRSTDKLAKLVVSLYYSVLIFEEEYNSQLDGSASEIFLFTAHS